MVHVFLVFEHKQGEWIELGEAGSYGGQSYDLLLAVCLTFDNAIDLAQAYADKHYKGAQRHAVKAQFDWRIAGESVISVYHSPTDVLLDL